MAEEGWTQGNCQAAPSFPSLLINALESLGVTERPRYYIREYEHHGTLRCRVILVIARSNRYPDIQPWRVTATGFRHQDTYPLTVRKALHYLCRIFEGHLAATPVRFFLSAIRTPVWEARMRSLERRRHEEGPLYQVATYLAALDQLFDEQANLLREQTHRAEQAELAVRLQQIRAAQAEARAAAAVSSEAVAQESLRQARDRRMQEWTRSGTPVPAIGEDHVLLGTPVIGWGPLFGNTQAPPENPESSAAVVERDVAAQPLTDGNPENDKQGLLTLPAPEEGMPRE
ncbi:hypothetical protein PAHAL_2G190900 [Panicum hallii]|uniref:Uncharacterized protein n=1 Tax=Panicum hallii TaxID=206008 RepID=A0A2T8KPQ6_9POAL|nr:hypothetical protein PAHAL_2G190900 [Panicum hallii]